VCDGGGKNDDEREREKKGLKNESFFELHFRFVFIIYYVFNFIPKWLTTRIKY
jgi:hypothetical protein